MEFDWRYIILAGLVISAFGHLSRIISIIAKASQNAENEKENEENS